MRPHSPIALELDGREAMHCRAQLEAGPWRLVVQQLGIDIELSSLAPDGQRTGPVDNPIGKFGPETLVFTAAGSWRFDLEPKDDAAPRGAIRLELSSLSSADDQRLQAETLMMAGGLAYAAKTAESRASALAHFRQARELIRGSDPLFDAWALNAAATLLEQQGLDLEAHAGFNELVGIWRDLDEPAREAAALNNAALLDARRGENEKARRGFLRAQQLHQDLGHVEAAAITRHNLCLMLHREGALEQARACYQEVLPPLREINRRGTLAKVLNNLGGVFYQSGDAEAARRHFEEALTLRRALGDLADEAETLNNLASLARHLGRWQDALALYRQALDLQRAAGDQRREAMTHNNLGYAYLTLGQLERALPSFERALDIRRQLGDRRGQAVTLNNLGSLHHQQSQYAMASAFRSEALEIRRQIGDRRGEARTQVGLAGETFALGDSTAALRRLESSISLLREIGDRPSLAWALAEKGRILLEQGDLTAAMTALERAIEIFSEIADMAGSIAPLVALAETQQRRGSLRDALELAERAAHRLETLRNEVGSPELRSLFTTSRLRAFELPVEILMQLERAEPGVGYAAKALEAAERSKARSLLDLLVESSIDPLAGVDEELLRQRRSLEERLRLLSRRRQILSRSSKSLSSTQDIDRALDSALAQIDQTEAAIRRAHPQYAELVRPSPLDLTAMQQLLDHETTLLYFHLGSRRSFLWRVTKKTIESFALPERRLIETLASRAHGQLGTLEAGSEGSPSPATKSLSELLLGPLSPEPSGGRLESPRLAIVADGALHWVPFAALLSPSSGRPLIERHEIVSLPSASALGQLRQRRKAPPRRLAAVFADPVFSRDDPRLATVGNPSKAQITVRQSAPSQLTRLPASRLEAEAIAAFGDDVWRAVGLEAQRQAVLGGALEDFRFIHFATHGSVDIERPELTGLMLSTLDAEGRDVDGFLGLRDIYDLRLSADLVVLSGCRTGLGQHLRGEGLVGLSRGFFYAGASRVVASLWQVEDRATAELMRRFYRGLLERGERPAAALRSAQLEISRERRWRAPYYWAGFILIGDWR